MKKIALIGLLATALFAKNQIIDYKGEAVTLPLSAEQTNRIVLPSKITSKVFSKEKNLEVAITDKQAFVKFSPIVEATKIKMDAEKEAKLQKQELRYQDATPVELHLLAEDNNTYTFILVPSAMDAQTVIVENTKQKKKELEFKESQTPFRNTLDDLTKKVFSEKELHGYSSEIRGETLATGEVDIVLTEALRGAKLDVFVVNITNTKNEPTVIQERDLISLVSNKSIYRIAIFYDNEIYEIPPYGAAKAILIVAAEEGK